MISYGACGASNLFCLSCQVFQFFRTVGVRWVLFRLTLVLVRDIMNTIPKKKMG